MTDHAAMAPRTEDRLPLWGRLLLLIAAPGSLYPVSRLVYEQTIATWQNGPLMIGFGLVHGNMFLPLFASIVLLALWTLVVALRSIVRAVLLAQSWSALGVERPFLEGRARRRSSCSRGARALGPWLRRGRSE